MGEERARELVKQLHQSTGAVVDDAEADLRARIGPDEKIVRSGAPVSYLARIRFGDQMRSVCVGTVYQAKGNPAAMNSIQLHRDGVLLWRRE